MRKNYLPIIGLGLFFSFLVYTYFVAREYLIQFDFDTTVRLQDNISIRLDSYFSSFSLLGSFELTTIIFIAIIIIGAIRKRKRLLILAIYPLFHVVEVVGKSIIDQVGPPHMFLRYAYDFHFPSSYVSVDFFSYPSGHVGRTALLTSFLGIIIYQSKLKSIWKISLIGLLAAIFLIMFISRVSLGEHWISDVIGGALLGFAFGVFGAYIW